MNRRITRTPWYLVALFAAACGGGGGVLVEGGTSGTGISRGPVTAVGSIGLNGRTLDTDGAAVRVNGEPASLAAIAPGHVVRVETDFDAGRALAIDFTPDVVGRVDAVSLAGDTGTLTVLGQSVVVDADTVIADFAAAGAIAVGDRVRVSGLRTGEGDLLATRIESAVDATDRVVGIMHSPGIGGADSLRVGGLTVDHSMAAALEFPGGTPTAGDRIAVAGRRAGDGVLEAERIEPHVPVGAAPGESVEVTGVLEGVAGTDDLAIEGIPLQLSEAQVTGGSVADGVVARVRGRLDAGGRLRVTTLLVDP